MARRIIWFNLESGKVCNKLLSQAILYSSLLSVIVIEQYISIIIYTIIWINNVQNLPIFVDIFSISWGKPQKRKNLIGLATKSLTPPPPPGRAPHEYIFRKLSIIEFSQCFSWFGDCFFPFNFVLPLPLALTFLVTKPVKKYWPPCIGFKV